MSGSKEEKPGDERRVVIGGREHVVRRSTTGERVVERPYRSLVKAVSWRITGTLDTILVSFVVLSMRSEEGFSWASATESLGIAASIGVLEVFTKLILYYFHERIWTRLKLGRVVQPPPDYQI